MAKRPVSLRGVCEKYGKVMLDSSVFGGYGKRHDGELNEWIKLIKNYDNITTIELVIEEIGKWFSKLNRKRKDKDNRAALKGLINLLEKRVIDAGQTYSAELVKLRGIYDLSETDFGILAASVCLSRISSTAVVSNDKPLLNAILDAKKFTENELTPHTSLYRDHFYPYDG